MKLTKKEKEILTLLNDEEVSEFLDYAQKYVHYSKEEIKKIVEIKIS